MSDQAITELTALLAACERAVVFTGAGVSTESGIPDFRSPGGVWSQTQPVMFDDFVRSEDARREAWRQKAATTPEMQAAEPNAGHQAIAELITRGIATHVITQNIDGLHQRSGIAEDRIIELHGNTTYAVCLSCDRRHEIDPILAAFNRDGTLPVCEACGGLVKTATVSFGQAMPEAEMQRAARATLDCDLFLAIGSSLVVYPAAGFPELAKQNGARLVILNRDPTEMDGLADLVLHREIGATLAAAVSALPG